MEPKPLSNCLICRSVELKTALQKFVGLIFVVSNLFLGINNSETITFLISKVLYFIQQQGSRARVFIARFEQS